MADPTTLPMLSDAEWKALDDAAMSGKYGITPMGGSPSPPIPDSGGLPSMPSRSVAPLPATQEANIAAGTKLQPGVGKEMYARGLPSITAPPTTPEYDIQKLERGDYQQLHPWGSQVSEHPGTGGKIAHVLSKIGNVAGDIVAPSTMALIPDTDLNKRMERGGELRQFGRDVESQEKEAQTAGIEEANKEVPFTPFGQTQPIQVRQSAIPQLEAAEQRAQATTQAADTRGQTQKDVEKQKEDFTKPMQDALIQLRDAQAAVEAAKNDPNSPQYKLALQRLQETRENAARMSEALGLHQAEFANKVQEQGLVKPSGQSQSRASAAVAAQGVIKTLKDELSDPNIASQAGPLIGRMNAAGQIVGTISPELSALATHLENLYALMGTAHGWRAIEAPALFRKAMGGFERNPEAFIASLDAANGDLGTISKEGKTYHKRIVEGQENTPKDYGDARGKPEGSTGKAPDGTPVIVKNGKIVAQ